MSCFSSSLFLLPLATKNQRCDLEKEEETARKSRVTSGERKTRQQTTWNMRKKMMYNLFLLFFKINKTEHFDTSKNMGKFHPSKLPFSQSIRWRGGKKRRGSLVHSTVHSDACSSSSPPPGTFTIAPPPPLLTEGSISSVHLSAFSPPMSEK